MHEPVRWECTQTGHLIDGERFRCRTLTTADGEALLRTVDTEVIFREGFPAAPSELGESILDFATDGYQRAPYREAFAITDRASGTLIGVRYLLSIRTTGVFLTGGWLGPEWRGQGFDTDSLNALVGFAGAHCNAKSFIATTEDTNRAERGLYRAAGFRKLIRKPRVLPDSRVVRSVWFVRGSRTDFRDIRRRVRRSTASDTALLETLNPDGEESAR